MFALDDPRWATLRTHSIPWLRASLQELSKIQIPSDVTRESQHALSRICEDTFGGGDVSDLTVIAVPHMILFASRLPPDNRFRCEVLFLTGIMVLLVGEDAHGICKKEMATELEEAFFTAKQLAIPLITETLKYPWPESDFQDLLAALAACQGQYRVGHLLNRLGKEVSCPACDAEIPPLDVWGKQF